MSAVRDGPAAPRPLARYDYYRAVAADGVERIPSHWQPVRLRRVVAFRPSPSEIAHLPAETPVTFLPMEALSDAGRFDTSTTRPVAEVVAGYSYFRDGDVLRAKVTPCFENGKGALVSGLANGVGFGTTELFVLRPGPEISGRFLYYLTMGAPFSLLGEATIYGAHGVKRVDDQFVRNFAFGLPPLPEQRAIAAFLDRETARIDELVPKKTHLVELLEERVEGRILQAVGGGLARTDDRVSSDDPILPPRPSHWLSMPLRRLPCEVQTGPFGSLLHADDYVEGAWPVINPANIANGSLLPDDRITVDEQTRARLARYVLQPGDVVFGRRGELGRAALVRAEHTGWLCGTGTLRARFLKPVFEPRYLRYFLDTATRQYFEARAIGSTMGNLNSALLLSMPLLVPPLQEQVEIADFCDATLERDQAIRSAIASQVSCLQEHRQALITAAVTGQIDTTRQKWSYNS